MWILRSVLTPTLHAMLLGLGLTENMAIKILWTIPGSGYLVGFLYFDTNTEINTKYRIRIFGEDLLLNGRTKIAL